VLASDQLYFKTTSREEGYEAVVSKREEQIFAPITNHYQVQAVIIINMFKNNVVFL